MTPGIADGLAVTFYFVFWSAIFFMVSNTVSYYGALNFNWLVVYSCAALFSYLTVWINKLGE